MRPVVEFSSCRSGLGPLTWAQKSMWNNLQRLGSNDRHLRVSFRQDLPGGVPVVRVVEMLVAIFARHDSLRTTYPQNAAGHPQQCVASSGSVPVAYVEAESSNLGPETEALAEAISAERFDLANELPVRVGLILRGDLVSRVLLCFSHMAVDAWSLGVLGEEMMSLSASVGRGAPALEPPSRQPLEQAKLEQEMHADGHRDRVDRYFRGILERCPPGEVIPAGDSCAEPRFWHGEYRSSAVSTAAEMIASKLKVSKASVYLGAFARMIGDRTGHDSLPFWIRSSNRFTPEIRRSVMYHSQNSMALVEVNNVPFGELVGKAHSAAIHAYRFASYDPDCLAEVMAEINSRRSIPVDLRMTFNAIISRVADRPSMPRSVFEEQARLSNFAWIDKFDGEAFKVFANVFGGQTVTAMGMVVDTYYWEPALIESGLRGIEERLISQALSSD